MKCVLITDITKSPMTAKPNEKPGICGAAITIANPSAMNRFCQMKMENESWPRKPIPGSENRRAASPRPSARS